MRWLSKLVKNSLVEIDDIYYLKRSEKNENKISYGQVEIIDQAKADADRILMEAKEAAQNITMEAIDKANAELEQARKQGFDIGFNSGKQEATEQNEEVLNELRSLFNEFDLQKDQILEDYKSSIKKLAMSIAKKIVNKELENDDEIFLNLYKNAVKDFKNQEWVRVSVSGHQADFATTNAELLKTVIRGTKYLDIIVLDDAPNGTCIVETDQGIVNTSTVIQFEKIEDAFNNN
jgi:flagellar assembly protein FliH